MDQQSNRAGDEGSGLLAPEVAAALAAGGPWHPATALCVAAVASLIAFAPWGVVPPWPLAPALLAPIPALLVAPLGRVALRRWLRNLLLVAAPLMASLLLVHGLIFPEGTQVIWAAGPLAVTEEGLAFGTRLAARYLLVLAGATAAAAMVAPAEIVRWLEGAAFFPRTLATALRAAVETLPAVRRDAATVREAQRARGLRTVGPLAALRSIPPLMIPVAASLLMNAEERAGAMAVRGYGVAATATSLRIAPDSRHQRLGRRFALALAFVFWAGSHLMALQHGR